MSHEVIRVVNGRRYRYLKESYRVARLRTPRKRSIYLGPVDPIYDEGHKRKKGIFGVPETVPDTWLSNFSVTWIGVPSAVRFVANEGSQATGAPALSWAGGNRYGNRCRAPTAKRLRSYWREIRPPRAMNHPRTFAVIVMASPPLPHVPKQ
jgi:hypothetical protein